jgi:hypothetical protein
MGAANATIRLSSLHLAAAGPSTVWGSHWRLLIAEDQRSGTFVLFLVLGCEGLAGRLIGILPFPFGRLPTSRGNRRLTGPAIPNVAGAVALETDELPAPVLLDLLDDAN